MATREKAQGLIYLRRSSNRQELGLLGQLEWALAAAVHHGVQVDASIFDLEYMQQHRISSFKSIRLDDAISGSTFDRPGFISLNECVRDDPRISHIFIHRRDRYGRPEEAADMLLREKRLRQLGVTLVLSDKIVGPIERGQSDLAADLATLLEYHESGEFLNKLAERVIMAQQLLARAGNRTGGNAPYGFVRVLVDPQGKVMEELPPGRRIRQFGCHVRVMPKDEAKLRVWILILDLIHRGWGAKRVAQHLNRLGIPSPDAGKTRTDLGQRHFVSGRWSHRTVLELARNEAILGLQAFGRRSEGAHRRLSPTGPRLLSDQDRNEAGRAKFINNDPSIMVTAETGFGANYDAPKWRDIQQILNARGKHQRGVPRIREPSKYPLSCLIIDMTNDCGAIMYARTSGRRRLYVCSRYMRTEAAECDNNSADAEAMLRLTLGTISQILAPDYCRQGLRERFERLAQQELEQSDEPVREDELALLLARKDATREQIETAGRRLAVEKDDELHAVIRDQYRLLKEELKVVQQSIDELTALETRRNATAPADQVEAALKLVDDWDAMAGNEQQRGDLPAYFRNLGLMIGLNFAAGRKGPKREVRRLVGGIMAFAGGELPVRLHGRNRVDDPAGEAAGKDSRPSQIEPKDLESQEGSRGIASGDRTPNAGPPGHVVSQREGISYTKVNRGDWI